MLENLKQRVYKMNMMLPKNNLVTMTSGNVSGRDPETNLVVIKPSGVLYDDMTPEDMVVVDLDGNVVEGKLKPSVDTATHLYVYKHRSDVNGIVHTHSPYATSFAALGRSIPVYLTAIADEFGCAIPVGPYAKIGGEEIGKAIVDYIGESPAILMKNHGV
ncbi:MAG: L-ribulose-5-phosphate 4-epimerase, partial [Thermoanaerobacterium sp.]|nr:L-ribulose-5-phosphate 4-epimerase [Thermoanaerobacterium sp.]